MSDALKIEVRAGERRTITLGHTLKSTGAAKNPSSATYLVYDPNLASVTVGTIASASAGTLSSTSLTEAADNWNGLPLEVTCGTTDLTERTEITDFAAQVLTFGTLSFTPAAGDNFRILGKPVLTEAAATVSGTTASFVVSPSDVTARPRTLFGRVKSTFSADDIQATGLVFEVLPSSGEIV